MSNQEPNKKSNKQDKNSHINDSKKISTSSNLKNPIDVECIERSPSQSPRKSNKQDENSHINDNKKISTSSNLKNPIDVECITILPSQSSRIAVNNYEDTKKYIISQDVKLKEEINLDCLNYNVQRNFSPEYVKVVFQLPVSHLKAKDRRNILKLINESLKLNKDGNMGSFQLPYSSETGNIINIMVKLDPLDVGCEWMKEPESYIEVEPDKIILFLRKS